MVFSFVDLFAEDFLLAAIVTFFVGKVNSSNDIIESVRDLRGWISKDSNIETPLKI